MIQFFRPRFGLPLKFNFLNRSRRIWGRQQLKLSQHIVIISLYPV